MRDISNYKLVVCIIKTGYVSKLVKAAKKIGVEGITEFHGRGTAHTQGITAKLGLTHDPERDIIMTAVPKEMVDDVVQTFKSKGKLAEKNTGILFVVNLRRCGGIAHVLEAFL